MAEYYIDTQEDAFYLQNIKEIQEILNNVETIKDAEKHLKTLIDKRTTIDIMLDELKTNQYWYRLEAETLSGTIKSIELNDKNLIKSMLSAMKDNFEQDIQKTIQEFKKLIKK
jgi:hypothetical protein